MKCCSILPISSRKYKEPLKHNNHGLTPMSTSLAIAIPFHAIVIVSRVISRWLMNERSGKWFLTHKGSEIRALYNMTIENVKKAVLSLICDVMMWTSRRQYVIIYKPLGFLIHRGCGRQRRCENGVTSVACWQEDHSPTMKRGRRSNTEF